MKIYISSTYRDLQKHRAAVANVLRQMGHQPAGMEEYVAEGAKPLHRCLSDVAGCDAYLLIVAWRYGYVPTEASAAGVALPADTALGSTSITEFEFRQAVQAGKPVLVFLLDPEAEWPSNQFDAISGEGEAGAAIARFRQELGQGYLVSNFRSPEELASLVSTAIYRAEMSRQMNLESLEIEARFNQPFIRNGPVRDSTLMEIKNVIGGPQEVQALQINIGQGTDWWMTRLYFLSSLAAELTPIEVIVFIDGKEVFVGITDPKIVVERLSKAYPLIRQYEDVLAQSGPPFPDLPNEIERRAGLWTNQMNLTGGEHADPVFVTKPELKRWFKPYMITQAIDSAPGENAAVQMQRLIDWPMRFVPLVEKGKFTRVVDKQALVEQIARIFVREQVSRALSTTR